MRDFLLSQSYPCQKSESQNTTIRYFVITISGFPISPLEKHGEDDYSVWFSEISENDPLWKELMKKYCNTGSSLRGTLADVTEEIRDNM